MAKGKLKHIHIEPNDDGTAQVKAHNQPPSGGNAPMGDYESNDEKLGASSPEEAGAHVTRMLKAHFGKGSAPADDMSRHPAKGAFGRGY